jgi:hypothetical protein
MIIGLILAVISWFIFHKIIISIVTFYIVTGIWKSFTWLSLRSIELPPILKNKNIGSFILGIIIWPIISILNRI